MKAGQHDRSRLSGTRDRHDALKGQHGTGHGDGDEVNTLDAGCLHRRERSASGGECTRSRGKRSNQQDAECYKDRNILLLRAHIRESPNCMVLTGLNTR